MECERFKKLLKSWYIQVQDEALAPARMVHFMEGHLEDCPVCMMDPEAHKDVKKIITLVLPQDKLKVVSRSSRKTDTVDDDEDPDVVEEESTDEDEVEDDDSTDDDEEVDEIEDFEDD